ncbi:hypothetical protein F4781DRAFT_420931 [Annulohypoxylon bovei var. microspora]|nr:hypothetical protein F4781DRAFT_420931 [Annulohypoxylon bovei var. microspora]
MSYQYASPQEIPELGASQAGYMGSHLTPTGSHLESNHFPPARRRESLSKEFKLKRSVSTPNVRPQGTNEADPGTLGPSNERRRNRLGYQRTPIACRHCRKRKIRCKQPETPDVLRRCESCINLNIECVYSAVNQPPPPTTGQRQGTRASVGTGFASPSTSPAMPTGCTVETQPNPPYHQLATMPSMPSMSQRSIEAEEDENYSPRSKIAPHASSSRAFGYEHGTGSWVSTDTDPNAAKMAGNANDQWANYPDGLPEASDLSSYASHAPAVSLSTGWSTTSPGLNRIDTNTRLDDTWRAYPPGIRSMSYSDDQTGHFVSPTRPYDRIQPPVATHVVSEASIGAHGSLSAGAVPHAAYNSWRQPYQYSRSNEDYGAWYEDREHHASEAQLSPMGEDPSQAGGIYYGER